MTPFQPLWACVKINVPVLALVILFVAVGILRAAFSVKALLPVTSKTVAGLVRINVLPVAKDPVARRVALVPFRLMVFEISPIEASLATAKTPSVTLIVSNVPPNVLVPVSARVPVPAFVMLNPIPETAPAKVSPWVRFDAEAELTTKNVFAEREVAPETERP